MKQRVILGNAVTPDGSPMTLSQEGADLVIRVGGRSLMSSRQHGSEEAMAQAGCAGLRERPGVRVLVGGLGMGFTLRAALDELGADATVLVSELMPAVVAWNRGPLAALAGEPLGDPRTVVLERDVAEVLGEERGSLDAILLDVDNGPGAVTTEGNDRLYSPRGVRAGWQALRPGGRLVVWSAHDDAEFVQLLRRERFAAEARLVSARGAAGRGAKHWLFIGQK